MQFPVHLTFERLSWKAKLRVTDAAERTIGYAPVLGSKEQRFTMFADQTLAAPIYTIGADNPFHQWFEDAGGKRIGHYSSITTAAGKYVHVASEPRFVFIDGSPTVTFIEHCFPDVPILNAVTGAMLNPLTLAIRMPGREPVLRIAKTRLAFDVRYSLEPIGTVTALELECLLLASIIESMLDLVIYPRSGV